MKNGQHKKMVKKIDCENAKITLDKRLLEAESDREIETLSFAYVLLEELKKAYSDNSRPVNIEIGELVIPGYNGLNEDGSDFLTSEVISKALNQKVVDYLISKMMEIDSLKDELNTLRAELSKFLN